MFLGCSLTLLATTPYEPTIVDPLTQSWRWKQFPELEGKGIRGIFEGRDQTVWIPFNNGIYEYNGYEWKLHNQENGLDASPMEQVYVAKDGTVYAASATGIFQLVGRNWTKKLHIPDKIPFQFNKLTELSPGIIAAPSNRGLVLLGDYVRIYTSETRIDEYRKRIPEVEWVSLPNELTPEQDFRDITDIIQDREDRVWLAVNMPNDKGRLLSFHISELAKDFISQYEVYTSNEKFQLGDAQKMMEDKDGAIWVINAVYKTGISVLRDGKWEYIKLSDQFSGDEYMTDIVQSDDGTIWIGSLGKLYAFKDQKWAMYTAPDYPIPANRVLLQKSKGNYLWVAGYKSKVFFLDFSFDNWISYADLNFQFQEADGAEWYLEVNGKIVRQQEGVWQAYGVEDGLMDAPIRVVKTRNGQIWAAGSHKGMAATALLRDGVWERQLHARLSWGVDYRSVYEDRSGNLWFGGAVDSESDKGHQGGVMQLLNPLDKDKRWVHHPGGENGLSQSNVYGIGQSPDGRIWIGGSNFYGLHGDTWQRHTDSRLQQFVNVVSSNEELLLAGSRYYGVFMFDGKQWRNFDNSNGLSGNTVISMDIVSPDCIYVATENDICRFDGNAWVSKVFPEELNMDFEGGMLLHDREGSIWINKSSRSWKRRAFSYNKTREGEKHCFVAHKYRPDKTPPETVVTMFSKEVSPEGNTLVKWDGNDFFAQSAHKELMYSYKLGDADWSPYSTDNNFTFMSLSNGTYTLQVRARDQDLNVDPTPAVIEFTVLPPVWKQMWFILLLLAFFTVLGVFEYRIITKKRKLELLNESLHQVNGKLQDKNEKIASQNEEILTQQEQIIKQAKVLELANQNLEERNAEIKQQKDRLEEMVVQIEELSKAKLGFFTNISHELRTPLTLISGPVDQLIRNGHELPECTRNGLYQIIDRNSNRLLKLINQLLEIRRIENSNLDLNFLTVSLSDFIGEIVGMFENLAVEKEVYLEFEHQCPQDEWTIDPDKMEKIMVNLLSNAFKHTASGGSIIVKLNQLSAQEAGLPALYEDYLEIRVEDTGCGIREEDLQHIYERFFASEPQKADPNSSGIGLAYIKELVNVQRGEIRVDSQVGVGTVFTVFLPCIRKPEMKWQTKPAAPFKLAQKEAASLLQSLALEHEIKAALAEEDNTERRKILVVEDHKDMQLFLESFLSEKYDVIKAGNGKEGLKKAQAHTIDLIVSDVMMPEMDGLSFCEKIKSDVPTSHIPVILLTAKVLEENTIEGFEKGADAYVTKPFSPELLMARIENLLQQRDQLKTSFNRDFLLTPQKVKLASPDEELLQRIVEIMEEHLEDTDFNVNQMCKMVHLSHMHFIRKVKQLTGKKPIDLLKSFRLKRAKDLLAQNNLSISEVAYRVGYDLPNSFSRAFKKEFGMSPKEFAAQEEAAV
ncbi:response regulator [Flavilitoribacter nigricans]|nr:response regulator [Flavilitoribacter nigricans]